MQREDIVCSSVVISDLQARCPIVDRWWETQLVYIILFGLRYRQWLRTMYGNRFHCLIHSQFAGLYQVMPVPHLDAATHAFYGVQELVWGLSRFSPQLWELALGRAPLAYFQAMLVPVTEICCALFLDLPYLMNQATGEGAISGYKYAYT
jgi:hypothetical protein